jgi:hypothetical protein
MTPFAPGVAGRQSGEAFQRKLQLTVVWDLCLDSDDELGRQPRSLNRSQLGQLQITPKHKASSRASSRAYLIGFQGHVSPPLEVE